MDLQTCCRNPFKLPTLIKGPNPRFMQGLDISTWTCSGDAKYCGSAFYISGGLQQVKLVMIFNPGIFLGWEEVDMTAALKLRAKYKVRVTRVCCATQSS